MKTFSQLAEEVRAHSEYNTWHDRATKHTNFSRFGTAKSTGLKEYGSKKLTIYALDQNGKPLGMYSHAFGRGVLSEK